MTRLEYLETRIEALEARLDLLSGRPRGPITYIEAERAMRNGDGGRMLAKYVEQLVEGGDRQTRERNDGKLTGLSAEGSV